ncbi:hypothetical protein E3N88_30179 [Mikania micrantha]|uniref:DUF4218 domain-containing protein n=1 Tax=Mikania micrantha TaxID=192012 RepID=A0A5N6MLK1_9ASTR|nr:hypothetical protein E3N88_30179 [Mikania micrantha]
MYPFERYMGFLKGYVRNRNRPEGRIVERYASEKVIEFCTSYLEGVKSIGVPQSGHSGKLEGVGGIGMKTLTLGLDNLQLAYLLVLKHMTCLGPYADEHLNMLRSINQGKDEMWYVMKHNKEFSNWMKNKVMTTKVDETVKRLGQGPYFRVKSYQSYDINGYTFYTKDQDKKSTMQNNGVTLIASTTEFDRAYLSKMLRIAKDSYYGVIQEIWELDYHSFVIPAFKCKWVNNRTGIKVDNHGFTLVDLTSDGCASEPFVLVIQVTQVFYVNDPSKPRFHIVLQGKRHILGVDNVTNEDEYDQFDDLPPFSVGIRPTSAAVYPAGALYSVGVVYRGGGGGGGGGIAGVVYSVGVVYHGGGGGGGIAVAVEAQEGRGATAGLGMGYASWAGCVDRLMWPNSVREFISRMTP